MRRSTRRLQGVEFLSRPQRMGYAWQTNDGLTLVGINGFVAGPVIGAMFIAVWHIYIVTRSTAATEPAP